MIEQFSYLHGVEAARALIEKILEAMEKEPTRIFHVALSGGKTPAILFDVWRIEYATKTKWKNLYFYWVDERCVPPTDPRSNFGLAYGLLFNKVQPTEDHYFRIIGEDSPMDEAYRYSDLIESIVPMENSVPIFDFVILGIGDDGHTSSIFPNEMELLHVEEPYVVSENPYDSSLRICLTGRPLVKAHHSYFLVVGETKKNIVEEVLKSDDRKSVV